MRRSEAEAAAAGVAGEPARGNDGGISLGQAAAAAAAEAGQGIRG